MAFPKKPDPRNNEIGQEDVYDPHYMLPYLLITVLACFCLFFILLMIYCLVRKKLRNATLNRSQIHQTGHNQPPVCRCQSYGHHDGCTCFQTPSNNTHNGLNVAHNARYGQTWVGHHGRNFQGGVQNPVFEPNDLQRNFNDETPANNISRRSSLSISASELYRQDSQETVGNRLFEIDPSVQSILAVSNRSTMKTISGKLVVFVTHEVTYSGDILYLDNMGISLVVPQGAVRRGQSKKITLLLNWDLGDNPDMNQSQALVSPVIFVGPHGLTLDKPCILTYRHCSYDTRHIQVMQSETNLFGEKNWQTMSDPGQKNATCTFSPDECFLKITTFTLYTCLQAPPEGQVAKKWLQIAVFAAPLRHTVDHQQVRIYFLNKTYCALQWAIHNETQFGGRLICPEKLYLMEGDDADIVTHLGYVSRGWTVVDDQKDTSVPYLNIWHGKCPHIVTVFRRENPEIRELNFVMNVSQVGRENESERLVAQSIDDVDYSPSVCMFAMKAVPTRYIPQCLRTRLKIMLDPHSMLGRNWKCLAEKLGYDGIIPYLDSKADSPTEVLLEVVENTNFPLDRLIDILLELGRHDAAKAVQEFVDTQPKSTRTAVENDLGEGTSYQPNIH